MVDDLVFKLLDKRDPVDQRIIMLAEKGELVVDFVELKS